MGQVLELPDVFDTQPPQTWSPDGAAGSKLPSNSESYFGSLPDPFSSVAAWQQPLRQKASSIEATFTPTAAGLCSGRTQGLQLLAGMGALISEALKQGIPAGLQQSQRAASVQSDHLLPPDLPPLA